LTAPSIDVVIPVHNGWDYTQSCLEHLRAQTLPHKTIVCDNGSTDGTSERVRTSFPEVDLLELGENRGFAIACNRGVRAGSGELVVLLNNDVDCRPEFLEALVEPFRDDQGLGSVAARLLKRGETRIESFGLAVDPTLAGYPRLRNAPVEEPQETHLVLAGPSGAAGAYRRRGWDEVGGLDEGVFSYGEDVDLALRLQSAGWSTAAAPDAIAVHVGSATARSRSAWQRYQGGFGRGYFLRRYGVLRGRRAFRALATEAIVLVGDTFVYSRDLAAVRGRIAGWRAAAGLPRHARPPDDAVDQSITFLDSLRLRRSVYRCTSD
jgi:N-acetylglucosaminyl-diphospho-decaprenol L-rhamnosyltransferase